jgi:large subunit ribosomal protein L24e
MAVAREKQRAHRKKTLHSAKESANKLVEPISAEKPREKIKVLSKQNARSALIAGEGRSMGMDVD